MLFGVLALSKEHLNNEKSINFIFDEMIDIVEYFANILYGR